jgi:ABC-2 type transport system ATP-binding protein
MGAWLNHRWDTGFAARRVSDLGLNLRQRAGSLSGGQRAQLALTLATAKRPELLLLDEPVASLDPLARREFLRDETEALLAAHHRLSGPRRDPRTLPASRDVIEESHAGKQSTLLVRTCEPVLDDPAWTVRPVSLEDMVLAYREIAS